MEQKDLIKLREDSGINSETYQRTKDRIEDIRGDTNNNQIGNLTNTVKQYKIETDRNIKSNHRLTVVAIGVALLALLFQIVDFVIKYSYAK
jgi:hypothetical protein